MIKEFTQSEWELLKSRHCFKCAALGLACRGQVCSNNCDYYDETEISRFLRKAYINQELWDTGEVTVKDPIQFESYGAKLRNLLGPYCNIVEIIKHYNETADHRLLSALIKGKYEDNLKKLIEFSKLPAMEQLNIREVENFNS